MMLCGRPHEVHMASRRRTTAVKPKTARKVAAPKLEEIYTWTFESGQPRGGSVIHYVTQMREDGSLRCNCPGWIFAKKDQPRGCKHTKLIDAEATSLYNDWKKNDLSRFTVVVEVSTVTAGGKAAAQPTPALPTGVVAALKPKYGRTIQL